MVTYLEEEVAKSRSFSWGSFTGLIRMIVIRMIRIRGKILMISTHDKHLMSIRADKFA
jgi:hypothetical protein